MARVTIPIGPQHPALKEPEKFTIVVEGETVVDADVRIGHIHRGIEKLAESKTYIQNLYLTERICGICSFTHTTNFSQATEYILGIEPPPRGLYLRTLVNEFQTAGTKSVLWDGLDNFGQNVASGVYIYKIESGDLSFYKKMILMR